MSALREVLVRFGIETDAAGARKAASTADGLAGAFKKAAGVVSAGLIANKLKDETLALINLGDEIGDTAEKLNISGKELQRWRFIAESAGAEASELGVGFKILQKNAVEAVKGNAELGGAFKEIGLGVADLKANLDNPAKLFELIGLRIAKLPTQSERSAMAMKLLGKSGASLVPIFNQGEKGLAAFSARFEELGGGLSDDALDKLGDADQKLRELELVTRKAKGTLASALLPTLTKAADGFAAILPQAEKAAQGTNLVEVAVAGLGLTAAGVAVSAAAPYAPFILTAGAAVASITDVFNAFDSGSSKMLDVIGKVDKFLTGNDLGAQANREAKSFADDPTAFIQRDNNAQNKADFDSQLENLRQGFRSDEAGRGRGKGDRIFDRNAQQFGAVNPDAVFAQLQAIDEQARTAVFARNDFLNRNRTGRFGGLLQETLRGLETDPTAQAARGLRGERELPATAAGALGGPFAALAAQQAQAQRAAGLSPAFASALGAPAAGLMVPGQGPGTAPVVNLNVKTTNTTNVTGATGDPNEIAGLVSSAQAKSTGQSLEATRNALVPVIAKGGA